MPPVDRGTQRSRGIESITTFLEPGLKRTMIIDWVSTLPVNFVSLSEPSSNTVKAPGGLGGVGVAVPVEIDGDGVGDGTTTDTFVASKASWIAGRKYANPPAALDRATAITAMERMRRGLRRPCEARARRPGRWPSSTGVNSSPTARPTL